MKQLYLIALALLTVQSCSQNPEANTKHANDSSTNRAFDGLDNSSPPEISPKPAKHHRWTGFKVMGDLSQAQSIEIIAYPEQVNTFVPIKYTDLATDQADTNIARWTISKNSDAFPAFIDYFQGLNTVIEKKQSLPHNNTHDEYQHGENRLLVRVHFINNGSLDYLFNSPSYPIKYVNVIDNTQQMKIVSGCIVMKEALTKLDKIDTAQLKQLLNALPSQHPAMQNIFTNQP